MRKTLMSALIGTSLVIGSLLITPQTAGAAAPPPVNGCSTLQVNPCEFEATSTTGGYVAATTGSWEIYRTSGIAACENLAPVKAGNGPEAGSLTLIEGVHYCVAQSTDSVGAVSAGSPTRPAAAPSAP